MPGIELLVPIYECSILKPKYDNVVIISHVYQSCKRQNDELMSTTEIFPAGFFHNENITHGEWVPFLKGPVGNDQQFPYFRACIKIIH